MTFPPSMPPDTPILYAQHTLYHITTAAKKASSTHTYHSYSSSLITTKHPFIPQNPVLALILVPEPIATIQWLGFNILNISTASQAGLNHRPWEITHILVSLSLSLLRIKTPGSNVSFTAYYYMTWHVGMVEHPYVPYPKCLVPEVFQILGGGFLLLFWGLFLIWKCLDRLYWLKISN